jgi:hypothetical protein
MKQSIGQDKMDYPLEIIERVPPRSRKNKRQMVY